MCPVQSRAAPGKAQQKPQLAGSPSALRVTARRSSRIAKRARGYYRRLSDPAAAEARPPLRQPPAPTLLSLPAELRHRILAHQHQTDLVALLRASREAYAQVHRFLWCAPEISSCRALRQFAAALAEPDGRRIGRLELRSKGRYVRELNLGTLPRDERRRVLRDADVLPVLRQCPNLASLRLASCALLTPAVFAAIADTCTKLEEVDFSNVPGLTVDTLERILAQNPHLERIELANAPQVSQRALCFIAETAGPRLRTLDALLCSALDDDALCNLAAHSPGLEQLNLGGCDAVTDRGLFALAQHCPRLELLSLRGLSHVTNRGLVAIAAHCPHLRVLDVSQTDQVTMSAVRRVLATCPLRELDCQYAFNLLSGLRDCVEHSNLVRVNGLDRHTFLERERRPIHSAAVQAAAGARRRKFPTARSSGTFVPGFQTPQRPAAELSYGGAPSSESEYTEAETDAEFPPLPRLPQPARPFLLSHEVEDAVQEAPAPPLKTLLRHFCASLRVSALDVDGDSRPGPQSPEPAVTAIIGDSPTRPPPEQPALRAPAVAALSLTPPTSPFSDESDRRQRPTRPKRAKRSRQGSSDAHTPKRVTPKRVRVAT